MSTHTMVSMTNALPGQEDAFERWYAVHIREVVLVPGVSAPRRWRIGPDQAEGVAPPTHTYLTTYDLDGEPAEIMAEIRRRRTAGEWQPREGLDETTIKMWVYERLPDPDVS